jgi:hypothetical protein
LLWNQLLIRSATAMILSRATGCSCLIVSRREVFEILIAILRIVQPFLKFVRLSLSRL